MPEITRKLDEFEATHRFVWGKKSNHAKSRPLTSRMLLVWGACGLELHNTVCKQLHINQTFFSRRQRGGQHSHRVVAFLKCFRFEYLDWVSLEILAADCKCVAGKASITSWK